MRFSYFFVIILCGSIVQAHAEFEIFIPDKMIAGEKYEGIITMQNPKEGDITISMATDSVGLSIPETVKIKSGYNNTLFGIETEYDIDGIVTIHAVTAGHSSSAETEIFSHSTDPYSLLIVAPTTGDTATTTLGIIPMQIMLVDSRGYPAPSDKDTHITISSSTDITFSTATELKQNSLNLINLLISTGSYSTKFTAHVAGDGNIYAVSDGLESDSIAVSRNDKVITVRFEITPKPAAESTVGYYLVWLERDNKVFIPDEDIRVRLQSSNTRHVAFGEGDKHSGTSEKWVWLSDGYATGKIYFRQATKPGDIIGVNAITEQYGSGTTHVVVAKAASPSKVRSAYTCLWIFPDKPSDIAWLTAGTYGSTGESPGSCATDASSVGGAVTSNNDTQDLPKVDDNTDVIQNNKETNDKYDDVPHTSTTAGNAPEQEIHHSIRPVNISDILTLNTLELGSRDKQNINTSTSGSAILFSNSIISTDNRIQVGEHMKIALPVTSINIPLNISAHGIHEILILQGGTSATSSFESWPAYGGRGLATLVQIPTTLGNNSEIAYLYVIDEESSGITDLTLDRQRSAIVINHDNTINDIKISKTWRGGVGTVTGTFIGESGTLQPLITGTNSDKVKMDVRGFSSGIEMWMPPIVYTSSEFPVSVHSVDDNGNPVARLPADSLSWSDARFTVLENRATAHHNDSGTISLISEDGHIANADYTTTINESEPQIKIATTLEVIRFGDQIIIEIDTGSMPDPQIKIDGTIPFVGESGIYTATPDKPGKHSAVITISNDGWETHTVDMKWTVEHMVKVSFDAISDDNVSLPIGIAISTAKDSVEINKGTSKTMLAGVYEIVVVDTYTYGSDHIYSLRDIIINEEKYPLVKEFSLDITEDTAIRTLYDRQITVSFDTFLESKDVTTQIEGNGQYSYKSEVILKAPAVPELYGLIWHIPDKWTGIPDNGIIYGDKVWFEAENSVSGYVEYEANYTIAISVILAGGVIPLVIIRLKSPDQFLNVADAIKSIVNKLKTKNKDVKDHPALEKPITEKQSMISKVTILFDKIRKGDKK